MPPAIIVAFALLVAQLVTAVSSEADQSVEPTSPASPLPMPGGRSARAHGTDLAWLPYRTASGRRLECAYGAAGRDLDSSVWDDVMTDYENGVAPRSLAHASVAVWDAIRRELGRECLVEERGGGRLIELCLDHFFRYTERRDDNSQQGQGLPHATQRRPAARRAWQGPDDDVNTLQRVYFGRVLGREFDRTFEFEPGIGIVLTMAGGDRCDGGAAAEHQPDAVYYSAVVVFKCADGVASSSSDSIEWFLEFYPCVVYVTVLSYSVCGLVATVPRSSSPPVVCRDVD